MPDIYQTESASSLAGGFSTTVVNGPLAMRMRRLSAARRGETGLQIFTLAQLAERLAGGFSRVARRADLEPVLRLALEAGIFAELTPLCALPGMGRALLRSLERLWLADVRAADHPDIARLADLALIEARVRAALPPGVLTPPDMVAAALARTHLAADLLGPVTFEHTARIPPVWRPLIEALRTRTPVTDVTDEGAAGSPASSTTVICSDPHAEVVESLRWARQLIASGQARPHEIAIAAAAPQAWDDPMQALAASADLPVHFTHGVPILATVAGQACAALAELLDQGLSQERVRRWLAHSAGRCEALQHLPSAPLAGIAAGAHLGGIEAWRLALARAEGERVDGARPAAALLPALERIDRGWAEAEAAGRLLLPSGAAAVWAAALRSAPAETLGFSLQGMRTADGRDPGNSVAWGPAAHLAGAPRPFVRLIGLTAGGWPRSPVTDPLLPGHILALGRDISPSRPDLDRQAFATICAHARQTLTLSYARRDSQGGMQLASPLLPVDVAPVRLERLRPADHAFSPADRLGARLDEASQVPRYARARQCWRARRDPSVTIHDGLLPADHPGVVRALERPQSATSLRKLLRDPQGFVWRYALGWRAQPSADPPLELDAKAFGDLVHLLLQGAVDRLEPTPGFGRATADETETALADTAAAVFGFWPLTRPAPPDLLWRYTLEAAGAVARRALRLDPPFQAGTRSWTEVGFGGELAPEVGGNPAPSPWDQTEPVPLPGAPLTIRGSIDRLELLKDDTRARVTDYKTGAVPKSPGTVVLAGGAELQRVLYAVAVKRHCPDAHVIARLIYLAQDPPVPQPLDGEALDGAIADAVRYLNAGVSLLRAGTALPGRDDPWEDWNALRLALPASHEPYRVTKRAAFSAAFGRFEDVWSAR